MGLLRSITRCTASLALIFCAWSAHAGTVVIPPDVTLEPLISGLNSPLNVRDPGDGSGRLFIVEQDGLIRIWNGTQLLATPFLDVSSITTSNGEQGLLGLAFHPDYVNNGRFFINFTADGLGGVPFGTTVVAEYQVSANPNVADANSRQIIFTVRQDFANHNGGQLQFGPDGYLYIGMGDGGSGNDPCNRAQTLNPANIVTGGGCINDRTVALLGKMLRIDINSTTPAGTNELCGAAQNGSAPYAIPNDNPFRGADNTCDEVWAFGLRNPFRFTFDSQTGDMWIGDVGQNVWEEVDYEPASAIGGLNYGWRECEGAHPRGNDNANVICSFPSVLPVLEYNRSNTNDCSVIGGYRYRGPISSLQGTYIYGDFCSGTIWFAQETSPGGFEFANSGIAASFLSSFGEDNNGNVYVTSFGTGQVLRFSGNTTDVLYADGFEEPGML